MPQQTVSRSARPCPGQGVQDILEKKKKRGIDYDQTNVACDYLCLYCYSSKIIQRTSCHASEKGIQTFLDAIFHGSSDADDAIQFINNQNLTMLVTRRTYTNPTSYTDDVVALLSWTGRNKSVVYIGRAAVSGGQVNLPSPLADSRSPVYRLPDGPELLQPLPKGFTWLGLMTVMFDLMERGTCHYKKLKSQYIYLHLNPTKLPTNTSPQPFWAKRGFEKVDAKLVIAPFTSTEAAEPRTSNLHA
jgi:hypothetical protein